MDKLGKASPFARVTLTRKKQLLGAGGVPEA
jgi:hypothetical protein